MASGHEATKQTTLLKGLTRSSLMARQTVQARKAPRERKMCCRQKSPSCFVAVAARCGARQRN